MDVKKEVIEAIKNVPLLSPSVSELLAISSNPNADGPEFVKVVSHDAILTAKILQIVNSAAYSLAVEVNTVDQAVSLLGKRLVVGIALSSAGGGMMTDALTGYESHDEGVWRHDLFCAIAARSVAAKARSESQPDVAFTGGLLHDIGKTVISNFLAGSSSEVLSNIDQGIAENYLDGEKSIVGLNHAEVGYEVAKSWQLPEVLQNIIRFHHNPGDAPNEFKAACYAVHLGDLLAMMSGHGTGSDDLQYALDENYSDYFAIDESELSLLLLDCNEEYTEVEALMANVMGG